MAHVRLGETYRKSALRPGDTFERPLTSRPNSVLLTSPCCEAPWRVTAQDVRYTRIPTDHVPRAVDRPCRECKWPYTLTFPLGEHAVARVGYPGPGKGWRKGSPIH